MRNALALSLVAFTFTASVARAESETPSAPPAASAPPPASAPSSPPATRVGVSAGAGFPSFLDVGLRLQAIPEIDLGAAYGGLLLGPTETLHEYEGDVALHLLHVAGRPRPPLFVRAGFVVIQDTTPALKEADVFVPVTFGAEWFFGSHFAVSAELGFAVEASHDLQRTGSCGFGCIDIDPVLLPSGKAQALVYF